MSKIYHYFVEGKCEEKLINCLKDYKINIIKPGKVEVFNFINEVISKNRLMVLNKSTYIVLVYDVDVNKTATLEKNLQLLKECGFKNIYHIQSIRNLEEEIVYSTDLKNINEMFKTKTIEEFKTKFIKHDNLYSKLLSIAFNKDKLWSRVNNIEPFNKFYKMQDIKQIKK